MSAPEDQAIRQRALDHESSFIVQAPAGSGKTELLTRRVLTLLCCVDEPEEIMAITFTRKAASEMRQRVVETLAHASGNPLPRDEYEREGMALARQVLERDQQLDWQILKNPQRLNLRTIDSLATQLAHRLPLTSTLGAPTGLLENADVLYQEAAHRFIEANMASLDLVLVHLGNKLDRAQSLLAGLLAKRDQWKRHVYNADTDHDQLRESLEDMLAELVESRMQHLCSLVPTGLEAALLPCLAKAVEFALVEAEGDISELGWEMQLWHEMASLPGSDISDLALWESIAFALLTTGNTVRKRVSKREGFPPKGDAGKLGVVSAELEAHKHSMLDVLSTIAEAERFLEALVEVRKLPAPKYKDEQWALLSQLITVLPDLVNELQFVFSEQAQVDFAEVSTRAALALGSSDAPTDLALSMDLRLRHLLVDEFQDTSQTQFRLFQQLLAPWEPGDGRTFFAVGDPMQSIYRFREGDVALFTQVQHNGIGSVEVEPLTLTINFRAAPVVTQWVNDTFGKIFPAQADADIGAVPYSPSKAHRDYPGVVQIHPLVDTDKLAEADTVARLCAEAIEGQSEHEVAILVRSRTQSVEIIDALRQRGLAYEAVDMDLLGDRLVVRDLISLTMALRYPHDRLHWLSLLRAPFVGLTLHDLHTLMHTANKQSAVIECLHDGAIVSALSDDARLRVTRLLQVIEPALQRSMRGQLVPWVESVWLNLGGPVVCASDTDLDAAHRAITLLYELEARGELWQKSAIDAGMSRLYAAPVHAGKCQIQIMTLHKSKGLEFDTVILPALDRPARGDSTQMLNWFESTIDGAARLLIAPFEQSGIAVHQRDKINRLVQRASQRCEEQEKLRLSYVACTRAKRYLHLVARASHNAAGKLSNPVSASLLAPLWPLFQPVFEAATKASHSESVESSVASSAADVTPIQGQLLLDDSMLADTPVAFAEQSAQPVDAPVFHRLQAQSSIPGFDPFQWQAYERVEEQKVAAIEFQWAGRDARDIGTVVHEQLQILASTPIPSDAGDWQTRQQLIRRQLRNLGMNDAGLDAAVRQVEKALRNTLDDERGRWILQPHTQARSEWALTVATREVGLAPVQRVIIDRTFVDSDGTRWIIDYKTGDHEGGSVEAFLDKEQSRYADQLNRYADIIRRIDERPVRVGLYFPLLKGWREWEPSPIG